MQWFSSDRASAVQINLLTVVGWVRSVQVFAIICWFVDLLICWPNPSRAGYFPISRSDSGAILVFFGCVIQGFCHFGMPGPRDLEVRGKPFIICEVLHHACVFDAPRRTPKTFNERKKKKKVKRGKAGWKVEKKRKKPRLGLKHVRPNVSMSGRNFLFRF